MDSHNLTNKQNAEWAIFLPAISSFYITGLGKQSAGQNYFPQQRLPAQIQDTDILNFYDESKAIFPYRWGLYSAGHADLVNYKTNPNESVIVNRDRSKTFLLADSGGFQIAKGQWDADWKDPNCPKAAKKRSEVLNWMEEVADYGMVLDIPTLAVTNQHLLASHGIRNVNDAVTATHINNQFFLQNRKGKCKFLNVLQGLNHTQSDEWYAEMKDYCDPSIYPDTHFNGWAFGGQTKIDIHLFLKRLTHIIYDGLLKEGVHDWIHCLGTSILEWAVLFSDVQRVIRKYHNPKITISFDCASPFYAAAKGLAYYNINIAHNKKWTYAMEKTVDDKTLDQDTTDFASGVIKYNIHPMFFKSPVTDKLVIKDVCTRGHTALGAHGKPTKTSWDTLSYVLIQAHNVYTHLYAVQEANRRYDAGVIPKMLMCDTISLVKFSDVVEEIFSQTTREATLDAIEKYNWFWDQFQAGTQGSSGKRATNASTMFAALFEVEHNDDIIESSVEDTDPDSITPTIE